MPENLLLPHRCKQLGALCLLLALVAGLLSLILTYLGNAPANEILLRSAIMISVFALPLVALSRERIEDEYISSLRGQTLIAVVYLYFVAGFFLTVYRFFGMHLLTFADFSKIEYIIYMIFNPFAICAVYVAAFNLRLWRLKYNMPKPDQTA